MSASFTFDVEKASAAIAYLASKGIPDLTKGKICKLVFLAEKHRLVRFGRPITGDCICAMKDGPVPSFILDMLNNLLSESAGSSSSLLAANVSVNRKFSNPHFEAPMFNLHDFLSESDFEALDSVTQSHGAKTFSELRRMTHDIPAYRKAWNNQPYASPKMAFEDFFEEDDEALRGALDEMTENAKLREAFAGPAF